MQAVEFDSAVENGRIHAKPKLAVPETMLLSEASLAATWNTPEEDAAWSSITPQSSMP
jgi:hypothetical protein